MSSHIGQNFLVNLNVAEKIVKRFLPVDGNILEIGPGKGVLTDLLVKYRQNNPITAIELDSGLYYKLKSKYTENFEVLNRDILKVDLVRLFPEGPHSSGEVNVIGNIPYYISKELMDWVIKYYSRIPRGVFMMQKEFVNKISSTPDSQEYNAQAVLFNALYRVEKLFDVQPGSFSPQPRVISTVFGFKSRSDGFETPIDVQSFYEFLQQCFSHRRKTLLNNLSGLSNAERLWDVFERRSINPKIRAEQLNLKDFLEFFHAIAPGGPGRF